MKYSISGRLIAFYGGTVALVLLLFKGVTTYGETRLEAPSNIDGHYLSPTLVNCPPDRQLDLNVQQSGIFINAALDLNPPTSDSSPSPVQPSSNTAFPLHGYWRENQLSLTGQIPALSNCPAIAPASPRTPIQIEATISPAAQPSMQPSILTGTITAGDRTFPLNAEHQTAVQSASPSH